jgi:outer membrane protein W
VAFSKIIFTTTMTGVGSNYDPPRGGMGVAHHLPTTLYSKYHIADHIG